MIRNPIPWPDGARCAVAFTFDMDAESLMHLYFPDTAPIAWPWPPCSGTTPRSAVPRLVDLLQRYALRQTFFVPGWCIETYPGAIDAILARGHELATTGTCTRS